MSKDSKDYKEKVRLLNEVLQGKKPDLKTDDDGPSLPPRSEVHQSNEKNYKIKLKFPVVRLLVLFFLLLVLVVPSYNILTNRAQPAKPTSVEETDREYVELKSQVDDEEKRETDTREVSEDETPELENEDEEMKKDTDTVDEIQNDSVNNSVVKNKEEKKKTEVVENHKENAELTTSSKIEYEIIPHKVKQGETLYSISMKYFKSRNGESIIKEWNQLRSNEVVIGDILEIPLRHAKTK